MRKERNFNQLRKIEFIKNYNKYAEGSCFTKFGDTHVICTASIEDRVPHWLINKGSGWSTAEYGMLPRSTNTRMEREASRGKQSGRTSEIQRLIGRSLRSVVDLVELGEKQIKIDCDVIQADGGTRTAAINGGFIALALAIKKHRNSYNINKKIIKEHVAAISCGIINGQENIDLNFEEDSNADVDANFVLSEKGNLVEVQSTAEKATFSKDQFNKMMELASIGISKIIALQKNTLDEI